MYACGVAKSDGAVVFCHGAVAGDVVRALVTDVKKNYAEAECVEILSPSAHRCEGCESAASCGGCAFTAVGYSHENEVKRAGIAAALRREGIRREVSEFFAPSPERYRNKAVFRFTGDGECGFSSVGTHDVAAIGDCPVCDGAIINIKNEAEKILRGECIAPADLTYLYIRYMKETDEASVVIGASRSALMNAA